MSLFYCLLTPTVRRASPASHLPKRHQLSAGDRRLIGAPKPHSAPQVSLTPALSTFFVNADLGDGGHEIRTPFPAYLFPSAGKTRFLTRIAALPGRTAKGRAGVRVYGDSQFAPAREGGGAYGMTNSWLPRPCCGASLHLLDNSPRISDVKEHEERILWVS